MMFNDTLEMLFVCRWISDFFSLGIWVWGTPIELEIDGVKTSVFYLDTEGFESVGKSNVYDDRWISKMLLFIYFVNNSKRFKKWYLWIDMFFFICCFFCRIFALATVMSSVLIYNLPETVCYFACNYHHSCIAQYELILWRQLESPWSRFIRKLGYYWNVL